MNANESTQSNLISGGNNGKNQSQSKIKQNTSKSRTNNEASSGQQQQTMMMYKTASNGLYPASGGNATLIKTQQHALHLDINNTNPTNRRPTLNILDGSQYTAVSFRNSGFTTMINTNHQQVP